jgi:hypothetical protein
MTPALAILCLAILVVLLTLFIIGAIRHSRAADDASHDDTAGLAEATRFAFDDRCRSGCSCHGAGHGRGDRL